MLQDPIPVFIGYRRLKKEIFQQIIAVAASAVFCDFVKWNFDLINEIIEFLKLHNLPYKNFDSVDKDNSLPYNQRLFEFCVQNKIII